MIRVLTGVVAKAAAGSLLAGGAGASRWRVRDAELRPGGGLITGDAPQFVAAGGFNRDGKSDLATASFLSNNVSVLLNTCGAG